MSIYKLKLVKVIATKTTKHQQIGIVKNWRADWERLISRKCIQFDLLDRDNSFELNSKNIIKYIFLLSL